MNTAVPDEAQPKPEPTTTKPKPELTEEEKRRLEAKFGWKPGDVTIRQAPPKS
jgi:hypothetical protein